MQVLVKLHADTASPYLNVVCGSGEERAQFVKQPHVWWYAYPEDDDMLWRQGGAWKTVLEPAPAPEPEPASRPKLDDFRPAPKGEDDDVW